MRQTGLQGRRRPVRRVRTTPADPTPPATDLVRRAFAPADIGAPGRLWVADPTYVATSEGRLYRAAVPDAFGRRVVGWGMADHPRTDLVLDALTTALQRRPPRAGVIRHSDHGRRHTAVASGARLRAADPVASVGSVGDRFDHAVAERFFATRRVELPSRGEWPTRAAAEGAIFRSIETWDHTRRRHSTLGYLRPAASEEVQQRAAVA